MEQTIPTREDTCAWVQEKKWEHLQLTLPTDFETYWKSVDGDVRTQHRKAVRLGYTAKWVDQASGEDIADIWDSWDHKQDRPINRLVGHFNPEMGQWTTLGCWPWRYYPHTKGYLDLMEVSDADGMVVAYIELACDGNEAVVFSTMGHSAYLRHGIMKFMFVEAIRTLISRGVRALYYMKPGYLATHPERAPFCNDLRFKGIDINESRPRRQRNPATSLHGATIVHPGA